MGLQRHWRPRRLAALFDELYAQVRSGGGCGVVGSNETVACRHELRSHATHPCRQCVCRPRGPHCRLRVDGLVARRRDARHPGSWDDGRGGGPSRTVAWGDVVCGSCLRAGHLERARPRVVGGAGAQRLCHPAAKCRGTEGHKHGNVPDGLSRPAALCILRWVAGRAEGALGCTTALLLPVPMDCAELLISTTGGWAGAGTTRVSVTVGQKQGAGGAGAVRD